MSESKHTPGPWHYEDGPEPIDQQMDTRSIHGPDNHGIPHAMVYDDLKQGGDIDANARLIAATPNLLAACKCERDDGMDGNILREAAETLRCRGFERQAARLEHVADAQDPAIAVEEGAPHE